MKTLTLMSLLFIVLLQIGKSNAIGVSLETNWKETLRKEITKTPFFIRFKHGIHTEITVPFSIGKILETVPTSDLSDFISEIKGSATPLQKKILERWLYISTKHLKGFPVDQKTGRTTYQFTDPPIPNTPHTFASKSVISWKVPEYNFASGIITR